MKIIEHILKSEGKEQPILWEETVNHSGVFDTGLPDTLVIHYTAGASLESSVRWLKNPHAQASAHLVVGKTGKIVQLAPFNIITWHAGKSKWQGRVGLNKYSIGIEIDNAGILEKRVDGYYTYFGKKIDDNKVVLASHKAGGEEKAWEAFTPEQLDKVEQICILLKEKYNIKAWVGHEDISPGRKSDPGPAFPLQSLISKVMFGRKEDQNDENRTSHSLGLVMADSLNIRTKPEIHSKRAAAPLPKGTKLKILDTQGEWSLVKTEMEGWVNNRYIKLF